MDKRELDMYKIEDVISDLMNNVPIKQIARIRRISKNTVKTYRSRLENIKSKLKPDDLTLENIMLEYSILRKKEKHSKNFGWLQTNDELIKNLQSRCNNILILYENLNSNGFTGSYSSLIRYISKNNLNKENAVIRIETKAGEVAQVDFGYIGRIYDVIKKEYIKAYVFVMVLCYSRDAYYEIVKDQNVETWCNCHVNAFFHFTGVPKIIIPDNLKSGIIKASFTDPVANKSYSDLARHYGFQINPCIPAAPEHKGKVEAGVKYVKNNFMPLREFSDFNDANNQLKEWNEKKARVRIHGTTRQKPCELFEKYEKNELKPLNKDRFEVSVWKNLKVYRDIHIQFDKSYYSVPYEYRGERVWVRKTVRQVAIFSENKLIAVHFPENHPGKRVTNPDHYPPDKYAFMKYDSQYCLKQAKLIGSFTYAFLDKILNEEPIFNIRCAQNIVRMVKKYESEKIEAACKKAIHYGNYTYRCIKNILENNMFDEKDLFSQNNNTKLSDAYARNIKDLLMGA
jgi:transposase